jgi:enoyl-CoA hydratase/3-hydroxyacyl-CoA dehydrogenase
MGAQIAALAAEAGYTVKCRAIEEKFLQRGKDTLNSIYDNRISKGRMTEDAKKDIFSRLTFLVDLKEAVKDADFIIEAVPEIMTQEERAQRSLELCLTTRVRSKLLFSITEIAEAGKHPERWSARTI